MQHRTQCSILMLKESSSIPDAASPGQQEDKYEAALQSAFATDDALDLDLTYVAPLTILPRQPSLLSETIAVGLPPLADPTRGGVWAFAVTSQNAVRSFVQALECQPDLAIREAWLKIPIYSLTGATLASVQKAGFKNINNPTPTSPNAHNIDSAGQDDPAPLTRPSFNNAEQLVDFLLSFEWPQDPKSRSPPPELWFLTGETRMKTLAEKLKAHCRPFQEIVVYETGPRLEFEQELLQWLNQHTKSDPKNSATKVAEAVAEDQTIFAKGRYFRRLIWLVGFSPRGVDLTMPVLSDYLTQSESNNNGSDPRAEQ
ncbi:hypothetical protein EMPS_00486 [Entomortierella parvispora]|uniref:Tetrapyrrole biosynthesis uroporphyrinogen III synthase domain-containing protein n=1 Tax=Entomortierella parvispora TaxID=205924 RepID=A0A9P3LS10_9FUNG|nr:hypothetical protein EMPS_00486 [Entomortierella parvispora]